MEKEVKKQTKTTAKKRTCSAKSESAAPKKRACKSKATTQQKHVLFVSARHIVVVQNQHHFAKLGVFVDIEQRSELINTLRQLMFPTFLH